MNLSKAVHRSFVIVVILVLSLAVGYAYSIIGHRADLKSHPREYTEYVEKYAEEYGVPEYIIYAVILEESGFTSNLASDDGRVGLMQISADAFYDISDLLDEENEIGILYDPETNIRYGTYYLSYLYTEYSRWKNVYAAYLTDTEQYEAWAENASYTDENGNLNFVPDDNVSEKIENIEEAAELYKELYYNLSN